MTFKRKRANATTVHVSTALMGKKPKTPRVSEDLGNERNHGDMSASNRPSLHLNDDALEAMQKSHQQCPKRKSMSDFEMVVHSPPESAIVQRRHSSSSQGSNYLSVQTPLFSSSLSFLRHSFPSFPAFRIPATRRSTNGSGCDSPVNYSFLKLPIGVNEAHLANVICGHIDVNVSGYSIDANNVVMYHVNISHGNSEVRPNDTEIRRAPSNALDSSYSYTIRHRYSEFKELYEKLSDIMITEKELTSRENSYKEETFQDMCILPPFPAGGFMSYIRGNDRTLIEQRMNRFDEILKCMLRHSIARRSKAFQEFISVDPSSILDTGSSYVSLRNYTVPSNLKYSKKATDRKRKYASKANRRPEENQSIASTVILE